MDDVPANNRARTIRRIANGVIVLALALPLIAAHFDLLPPRSAGRLTGRSLFWFLLVLGILALVGKKWVAQKKATARLVVAAVFLLGAGSSVAVAVRAASDPHEEALATFKARMMKQNALIQGSRPPSGATQGEILFNVTSGIALNRQMAALDEINERFAAFDLGQMLAPAALTSRKAIQASRVAFGRYQALIAERDALALGTVKENEGLIMAADLSDAVRTRVLARSRQNSGPTLAALNRLSQAQRAFSQATQALLDFAELRMGEIDVVGEDLVMKKDADAAKLDALVEAVNAAAERQSEIIDQIDKLSVNGRLRYG